MVRADFSLSSSFRQCAADMWTSNRNITYISAICHVNADHWNCQLFFRITDKSVVYHFGTQVIMSWFLFLLHLSMIVHHKIWTREVHLHLLHNPHPLLYYHCHQPQVLQAWYHQLYEPGVRLTRIDIFPLINHRTTSKATRFVKTTCN